MRLIIVLKLTLILLVSSCSNNMEQQQVFAFRLKPGEDLKVSIEKFIKENNIQAGYVVTCVGSLTNYNIRFANQPEGTKDTGHFEIVSLVGTLGTDGSHLHISIADSSGKTIGGHLLDKNLVYTTAEIVIGNAKQYKFTRKEDGTTPYKELQIEKLTSN
jgi:uncharacterized protein